MAKEWERMTYTNSRGESVVFSRASMYHVNFKDVSGLSDVVSTIYSVASMGQDGNTLVGTRVEARDIEIIGHFRTTDKVEIQALRRKLNRVLNPHETATLTYEFAGSKRTISCLPDSAPMYSRKKALFEQFTIQLSCLNPYWSDGAESRTDVAIWESKFEFPEPDGLEIIDGEWELGNRTISVIANVINRGDVDTGMSVTFSAIGTVDRPELIDVATGDYIRINTVMESGDQIVVTTGYGQKEVKLIKDGAEINAFRLLDVGSTYLQIRPGDNLYKYDAADGVDALNVVIRHNNLYLGV